jgi:hypothetical protein
MQPNSDQFLSTQLESSLGDSTGVDITNLDLDWDIDSWTLFSDQELIFNENNLTESLTQVFAED